MTGFAALLSFPLFLLPAPAAEPAPAPAIPAPAARPGGAEAKRPVTDRPNLGVQLRAAAAGSGGATAIQVAAIYPGSAAEAMGLKPGDTIAAMDGTPIDRRETLVKALQRKEIGSPVKFDLVRGGQPLSVTGAMGSFRKTREAFLAAIRRDVIGKPFATVAALEWPDGVDGLAALKGKVGIVVAIDGCPDCVGGNWRKFRVRWNELQRMDQDWIGMCGIYSNVDQPREKNLEDRVKVLAAAPATFPLGLARYPGDAAPLDSLLKEPIIQSHGAAILDPEGKVIYLEIPGFEPDNPAFELAKALEEAARKYGPKKAAPPPPAGKDAKDG